MIGQKQKFFFTRRAFCVFEGLFFGKFFHAKDKSRQVVAGLSATPHIQPTIEGSKTQHL